VRKANTKTSQTLIGMELAKKDYLENPINDPNVKVLNYTYGDSWYKYMKNAYILQWKNLK
jgi:hypothetical protein